MADNSNALIPPSLRGTLIGGEKYTGSVTGLALLAGLGLVGWKVLPILLVLLTNTLYAGGLAILLVILGYIAINGKDTAKLIFALCVRKIHNLIIKRDAYDFVRYIIVQSKIKLEESRAGEARLRGSLQHTKSLIDHNQTDIDQRTKIALAAQQQGLQAQRDMQARMIGNINKQNDRLKLNYSMIGSIAKKLQSNIENTDLQIQEKEATVELEIQTNQDLAAGKSAAADVVQAINGDPERKALFDQAMTSIAADSALMYGQIEQMTVDLEPMMQSIELGKIVDAADGEKLIASYMSTPMIAAPVAKVETTKTDEPVAVKRLGRNETRL